MIRSTNLVIDAAGGGLRGVARMPGDKSVSHRAVMLASLATGVSHISGFLDGGDCRATLDVMRALGVEFRAEGADGILVHGRGVDGLAAPAGPLDCASSGTTMRLLAGILAAQPFDSQLTGTRQLQDRPMGRVVEPLVRMGARIISSGGRAPLDFGACTAPLRGIDHPLLVASAQVKSSILLAGLYADGVTTVRESGPCRDHTERMLETMGADIEIDGRRISIERSGEPLEPLDLAVPGDFSSAAFLIVAATIVPESEVLLESVGVNPTRTGLLEALTSMGARIDMGPVRDTAGEPVADITVHASGLAGREFGGDAIVTMIDEIPVLALAATQASGTTVIRDASELRVKETDRIATTAMELSRLGATIEPRPDGMAIHGPTPLTGASVASHGDHRLAMMLAIAGLVAHGRTTVREAQVAADSFPGFEECLASVGASVEVT